MLPPFLLMTFDTSNHYKKMRLLTTVLFCVAVFSIRLSAQESNNQDLQKVETAKQYIKEGKIQPAIDILTPIANGNLDKNPANGTLGRALFIAKKWEDSIPYFERAIVQEPEGIAMWRYCKSESLAFLGRYRECVDEIKRLLKTHEVIPGVIWLKLLSAQAAGLEQEVLISLGELASVSTDPDRDEAHRKAALSSIKLYQDGIDKLDDSAKINAARQVIEKMKNR